MKRARLAAGLVLVLLPLAACSSETPDPCLEPNTELACLRVLQDPSADLLSTFVEGYRSYVEIEDPSGQADVQELVRGRDDRRRLTIELDAGTYLLTSFQRQCGPAGCEESGPEPERRVICSATAKLVAGHHTEVRIRVRHDGCSMAVGKPRLLVIAVSNGGPSPGGLTGMVGR